MTQFYHLSGAERLAVELAERLNKRGIHTDILSMYTADLPGVEKAKKKLLHIGIPSVYFLDMRIHPPLISLLPSILKLRQLLKEQRYDIIETSSLSPSVIAAWAIWGTRVRYVAGLHHVFKRNRENTKQHKLWRLSLLWNRHIRYYTISDYVSEQWIRYSKTPPNYVRRIYNAISDNYFAAVPERDSVRKELGLSKDVRLAIYVGRLASCKGIDTSLDALGPILEQNNLILLYVGQIDPLVEGTKEIIQLMERRIIEQNWGSRVQFLGYRKDTPRLMASADVLVHPTRTEGFGLTLVEAMATSLPIVASNVEGIPEVLKGTSSIMVPPDNPKALREMVLKTLNCPVEKVAEVTKKGRQRALNFRIDIRTNEIIKLFEDVLSSRF